MKSNVYEKIDFTLTPYILDPISYIGDTEVEWIIIIAPTQSGKTVFLQVVIADSIDQDPGPLLYLLPDRVSANKMIKEKIIDVIQATPCLSQHRTGRVRDIAKSGITLDHMTIYPAWAGSLATMSSLPMKKVVLDEVRLMKLTIGAESNAIKLSNDRLTTYRHHGIGQGYMVSSASVEGDLLHNQLTVEDTLVQYFHSQCPHCGEYQLLNFYKHVRYNSDLGQAQCVCEFCRGIFPDEDMKRSWNTKGIYAPLGTRIYRDGSFDKEIKKHKRMVFRYNSMVSPFRSFQKYWDEYQQTKDKIHDYKNFWQCWNAEFWVNDISHTDTIKLGEQQREYYNLRDVPTGTLVLMAGIDTQDNGFYVTVRAFGANKVTWLIDAFFIECKLHMTTPEDIHFLFERDIFNRVYLTHNNVKWRVAMAAIDTGGHRTKEIYEAAVGLPRLILVKGGPQDQREPIKYNPDINLYIIKTSDYLQETEDKCLTDVWNLPKETPKDYKVQFCNSRKTKIQNKKTGEETVVWKKVGQNDYRMADVHAFICLDIPTDLGTIRYELEKKDFKYNPQAEVEAKIKKLVESSSNQEEEEDIDEDFNLGDFKW